VAQALLDKKERKTVQREKDLAKDLAQKTAATWRGRAIEEDERPARLKEFSRIAQRRVMAQYDAQVLASKPARHDKEPFRRLAVHLYDFFSEFTSQPYRFMAAITGLFNLHPRGFCSECRFLPVSRKPFHRHKNQSLATMVREGTNMCKLENIFECPRHTTGRQTLKRIIDAKISINPPIKNPKS
jgi:hypothetical protein